jgi:hypothetical protein
LETRVAVQIHATAYHPTSCLLAIHASSFGSRATRRQLFFERVVGVSSPTKAVRTSRHPERRRLVSKVTGLRDEWRRKPATIFARLGFCLGFFFFLVARSWRRSGYNIEKKIIIIKSLNKSFIKII